jgi:hypothetical protein
MSTITIASGGSYDLTTSLTGGTIDFLNDPLASGTLTIEPLAFENTTFSSGDATIISTGIGGLIGGFQSGDTIVVRDLATDYAIFDQSPDAATQNTLVAGDLSKLLFLEGLIHETEVITVSASGIVTDNLNLVGTDGISTYVTEIEQALFGSHAQTADLFITISADTANSSLADATLTTDGAFVICYLRGTNILTPSGERHVEDLRPGDLVVSHSGGFRPVKWIGEQSFGARFVAKNRDRLPVKIATGALAENLPLRDLYVSPGHSLLLGATLVLARNLVNGVTITQPARAEDTHYYLVELETHDCVLAEGIWAESYADAPGLRNQFHNAADFYARFPAHITPDKLQLYAPRPETGPALEAALRTVLTRAEIMPGALRGYIETITAEKIEGWAWDEANPALPVLLEIFAGEKKLGEALACYHRGDLAAAGMGNGGCVFSFTPLTPLPEAAEIRVVRAADGAALAYAARCQRAA